MARLWIIALGISLGILVGQAASAEVTVLQEASLDNNFEARVLIESEIKKGDFDVFSKAIDNAFAACNRFCAPNAWCKDTCKDKVSLLVDLDSPGGDVIEAMQIGRLIRKEFLTTRVMPGHECVSACVFILQAGVIRIPALGSHVEVHRPKFDPIYFADLKPDQARTTYNRMVEDLRKYFVGEMGGSDEAFRLIMTTPSDQLRALSFTELKELGLNGQDPSYEEYSEALMIKKYGQSRWSFIKACIAPSGNLPECEKKAYERFPDK